MYRQSEKNLLSSNISSTRPHNMVNFGSLAAEIVSLVWGTPANFNGFCVCLRHCCDVAYWRPTTLCTMFGRILRCYTTYIFLGALAPDRILPVAKFTLRPSLAFSYIGTVTEWHSSSGRQPNCGVEQRAPPIFGRAAIRLGIGPHF